MSAILLKANGVSNPNLLINGDFQVWQRGTSFNFNVSNKYCADRWVLTHGAYYNAMKIDKHADGLQVSLSSSSGSGGGISQYIEGSKAGRVYTMSVSIGGVVYVLTGTPNANGTELSKAFGDFKLTIKWDSTRNCIKVGIWFSTINKTYIVNWAKLELGGIATKNAPKPYTEELAMCKRYYVGDVTLRATAPFYLVGNTYFSCSAIFSSEMRTQPSISHKNWKTHPEKNLAVPQYTIDSKGLYEIMISGADLTDTKYLEVTISLDSEIY